MNANLKKKHSYGFETRNGEKVGRHISSPFIGGLVFSGGHFVNSFFLFVASWVELAVVSIAVMAEQFFKAVKAVRLEVARICLVLAVFELLYRA